MTVFLPVIAAALTGPTCPWQGDVRDPFTNTDGRFLPAQMILEPGNTAVVGLVFHAPVEGKVWLDVAFDEGGATDRRVAADLSYLLEDGEVVTLHVVEDAAPATHVIPGILGPGVYTSHAARGWLPLEDVRRLASAGSVTRVRHTLLPGAAVTRELRAGQSRQLMQLFRCLADAPAESP
jgi:hypothetical protein